MSDQDDVSLDFQAQTRERSDDDALARMRALYGSPAAVAGAPAGDTPREEGAKGKATVDAVTEPHYGGEPTLGRRVLGDLYLGAAELPRAGVKATRDAAQAAIDLAAWAAQDTDHVPRDRPAPGKGLLGALIPDGMVGVADEEAGPPPDAAEQQRARTAARQKPGVQLPEIDPPKSISGGVAKSLVQALIAMQGAGALIGAQRLAAIEVAAGPRIGPAVAGALKGALGDFVFQDPYEERLSNMLQDTRFANEFTAWVEADPEDGQAAARFKNAVEGVVTGAVAELVLNRAARMRDALLGRIRAGQAAQQAQETARTSIREEGVKKALSQLGDVDAEDLLLGEAERARSKFVGAAEGKLAATDSAAQGFGPDDALKPSPRNAKDSVRVNWLRIDTPEDVKRAMRALVQHDAKAVNDARRGARSHAQTILAAEKESAWKLAIERRPGQALNAEELLALRALWVQATETLTEVAQVAARPKAPPEDLLAFRKMMQVATLIQREVAGATAEAGRALNALKIPARGGGGDQYLKQMALLLDQNGGQSLNAEMADKIATLAGLGAKGELGELVKEGAAFATTRRAWLQYWYAALLSAPTTHAANAISGVVTLGQRITERAVAARMAALFGRETSIRSGEAFAMMHGALTGFKSAMRVLRKTISVKGALQGDVRFATRSQRELLGLGSKQEGAMSGAFGDLMLERGTPPKSFLGHLLPLLDVVTQVPGRLMQSGDEIFKVVNYQAEIAALAYRRASEMLRHGEIKPDQFEKTVMRLTRRPDDAMKAGGVEAAQYATFTNTPAERLANVAKPIQDFTVKGVPAGRFVLPFANTPINILTYVGQRSPIWALSSSFQKEIVAGGARAELATAQLALGTMTMLGAMDYANRGLISGKGPADKNARAALERTGWKPYSMKVGGAWVSYNRLDPLGAMVGMAADTADVMANAAASDSKAVMELGAGVAMAIAKNVTSKSYMSGVANFFHAVDAGDAKSLAALSFFSGQAGSVVPSIVKAGAWAYDPDTRAVYGAFETIQSRLPYFSTKLPRVRDRWGRPVSHRSAGGPVWDATLPINISSEHAEPIDKALLELEYYPSEAPTQVKRGGVEIDLKRNYPDAYDRLQELAGNELKHPVWGLGMRDLLNKVVEGKHPVLSFKYGFVAPFDRPEDVVNRKRDVIQDLVHDFDGRAVDRLFQERRDIAAAVESRMSVRPGISRQTQAIMSFGVQAIAGKVAK